VLFVAEQPEAFPIDEGFLGKSDTLETGSYHLRPSGRPLVTVFLGGRWARALEAEGRGAATSFALEELAEVLGTSVRKTLRPVAETAWANDPYALGSYSHALPGSAGARAVLRRPVEDRIFFAGEAASEHAFSTAHGAYQSGLAAAEDILRRTGRLEPVD
jgi:monoamine oxidase